MTTKDADPQSRIESDQGRQEAARQFELLHVNPWALVKEFDGKRPANMSSYIGIPNGFVIDGTNIPEWKRLIRGFVIPLRPAGDGSRPALAAQLYFAGLKEQLGPDILLVAAKTKNNYPYEWSVGPIFRADLNQNIDVLKEEAKKATREDKTSPTASMKLRAIFAQLPWSELNSAPDWGEIFIEPLIKASV